MAGNKQFGKLLSEGISSVAMRQDKTKAAVEEELAQLVKYSRPMLQKWRQGSHLPGKAEIVWGMVEYCLRYGRVERRWAESLLTHAGYPHLINKLDGHVEPAPKAIKLESPERPLHPDSPFYIERSEDALAMAEIQQQGVTLTIKGSGQVGKSSLLMRLVQAASRLDKEVVIVDFKLFEKSVFKEVETFYQQFCSWITAELGLKDQTEKYWGQPLSNPQRCTRYMGNHLLPNHENRNNRSLLLALDNVDYVLKEKFQEDFFYMLRGWHNNRALPKQDSWKRLDLILVTSSDPDFFITNFAHSPFHVGSTIELADFDPTQVSDLNERHGSPLDAKALKELYELTGGHPYLVRLAFYLTAQPRQNMTWPNLYAKALAGNSPFSDYLHRELAKLQDKSDLKNELRQVMKHQKISEPAFFRLHSAGLIRHTGDKIEFRCRLYKNYFREFLKNG